jgi:DNA-binding GntR family transcriptional regulator
MIHQLVPSQALQERVYRELKQRIVDCDMLPGEVVSEESLTDEFKTSRTPVREALLRLQREQLVVIYPRQGTFVSQISLKDIHEIYQIRLLIEPRVARMACRNIEAADIVRFRDDFSGLDTASVPFKEWFRHDREFHDFIMQACDNWHLAQMYSMIMDQNQRMRVLAGRVPARMAATTLEHIEILAALLGRDEDRLEKAMAAHVAASKEAVLRMEGFIQ